LLKRPGDCHRPALRQILTARLRSIAERRDVDEQRRVVFLVVDRQAQVARAAAVPQLPDLRVAVSWPTSVTVSTVGALSVMGAPHPAHRLSVCAQSL
jgi:hypothetical protein